VWIAPTNRCHSWFAKRVRIAKLYSADERSSAGCSFLHHGRHKRSSQPARLLKRPRNTVGGRPRIG
jgi:hypothetical protein